MSDNKIILTEKDFDKLQRLVAARRSILRDQTHLDGLQEELERALVVNDNEVPAGVVTMNSRVEVTDVGQKKRLSFEIVYPPEANASQNKISVLAPIGTALLGARVGTVVTWQMPGGKRRLRIEKVAVREPAAHAA